MKNFVAYLCGPILLGLLLAIGCNEAEKPVAPESRAVSGANSLSLSDPIKVLDYHGSISQVQTALDQLALQNGWVITHVAPSAFASMTAAQIQSFDVLFVVSGAPANNSCGTAQWGAAPDYTGLLNNPNVGAATASGRKVITGLDSDWHDISRPDEEEAISTQFLTNAINWIGSGSSTGYLILTDGNSCSQWWTLPGSFLLPLFTASGANPIYGPYEKATIAQPTHPVAQGLPSLIEYCCHHTRISGTLSGFTTLMTDPEGLAATVVSDPCVISCPANITQCNDPDQCGAIVTFPLPFTSGDCGTVTCTPASGTFFPVGTTTVTCTAGSSGPSCSFTVTVNDCQAPTVTSTVALPSLFPPNHDLINVGLSVSVTDNCPTTNPAISVQVFGDEDDEEDTGDGRHSPDAKNIGPNTLRLRAERKGNSDGRVYLIVVTVTDNAGKVSRSCLTVVVPRTQSKSDIASVNAQAAAARAFCEANGGAPPSGYFVVGDGPVIGRKQ